MSSFSFTQFFLESLERRSSFIFQDDLYIFAGFDSDREDKISSKDIFVLNLSKEPFDIERLKFFPRFNDMDKT